MSQLITLIWNPSNPSVALEKFDGTVLVVSHDREFVNSIAKRIWVIDTKQNKIHDFSGTYDEYLSTKVS